MAGQYRYRQWRMKVPVVWMVSPGSRGTWFWNILTCAPYLRPGRVCKDHRSLSGTTTHLFYVSWYLQTIIIKPVMKRYFATAAK